jgi:transposase InsO family protein
LSERYLLYYPEERVLTPWPKTSAEWAKVQQEDEELMSIINDIRASGGSSVKIGRNKFSLKSTEEAEAPILVRVASDTRKGTVEQSMVPKALVKETLRLHHEGFAHMGANRMLETIKLRYFWSKMDQDIIKHTGKCINCKLRKSYQRRPTVPIMKYDDTARPLDRVHVDLTGPLPQTKGHHRYIMVIKDYLTKYVWLIPLKTKGAVEVAEAFVGEFICQAGIPGRVVSDRGNEFVNQLLGNISRILGINRVSTTPYNPRSDGFVENHNKTLKDQLYHYVDTLKQDDWDVYLPTVQLMYNTTVSLSTGFTPMLLMTGREARMPAFSHMAEQVDQIQRKSPLSNELVLKMVETMRGYHDFALKQTERNKGRFNVRVRQPLEFVEYQPGQKFLRVRRPISTFKSADEEEAWKISMKLLERFEGPYEIIRKINPVLYDAQINGKEVRVHAGNMKPF